MKSRHAFTMLELIFVIVVMGIIGKFGVEFLARAYQSFIFSKVNHTLQSHSASTVEFISTRLQNRIKDSIIARKNDGSFDPLGSVDPTTADDYKILEWVSADVDGFRGDSLPYWSGMADIEDSLASEIVSPETNTTAINALIGILSNSNSTVDDSALYFIGSNTDVRTGYGWDGNTSIIEAQQGSMHPIDSVAGVGNENKFTPDDSNLTEIYEYYKLAWTAYAVALEYNATTNSNDLFLYSDYQPWEGDGYAAANKKDLLMQEVDTFQFMAIGSIVKIQVCMKTDLVEDYSLCKEKTIY